MKNEAEHLQRAADTIKRALKEYWDKHKPDMTRYDLTFWEIQHFTNLAIKRDYWNCVTGAFNYGFVKGRRYEKACKKKERKA